MPNPKVSPPRERAQQKRSKELKKFRERLAASGRKPIGRLRRYSNETDEQRENRKKHLVNVGPDLERDEHGRRREVRRGPDKWASHELELQEAARLDAQDQLDENGYWDEARDKGEEWYRQEVEDAQIAANDDFNKGIGKRASRHKRSHYFDVIYERRWERLEAGHRYGQFDKGQGHGKGTTEQ